MDSGSHLKNGKTRFETAISVFGRALVRVPSQTQEVLDPDCYGGGKMSPRRHHFVNSLGRGPGCLQAPLSAARGGRVLTKSSVFGASARVHGCKPFNSLGGGGLHVDKKCCFTYISGLSYLSAIELFQSMSSIYE